jgi:hypothetical protein
MADFAVWVTAAAPVLGWEPNHFLDVYSANRDAAHELALEASVIAPAVRALAARGSWTGTTAELLIALASEADEPTRRSKTWPDSTRRLSAALRRVAPNLREVGVTVEFIDDRKLGTRRRQVRLKESPGFERSERSERSEPDNHRERWERWER